MSALISTLWEADTEDTQVQAQPGMLSDFVKKIKTNWA